MGEIQVFSNRIFAGGSWPLIIFNTVFTISVTGRLRTVVKSENGQDLLINNFLLHNDIDG